MFLVFIKPLDTCEPNPKSSYMKQDQKHEPSSFCYYIKSFDENVYKSKKVSYMGEDAAQNFAEMLHVDILRILYMPKKEIVFEKEDIARSNNASKCWICVEGEFSIKNGKVNDHCRFTGKFRGAEHYFCNLNYRRPKFTPVLFHKK